MPDYTIWRFETSRLHGQGSQRAGMPSNEKGLPAGTVPANNAREALTHFLISGGVEGRRIEIPVPRSPQGEDEASVEVGYQLYIARRPAPKLLMPEEEDGFAPAE